MRSKARPPTKAELEYMGKVKAGGCLACHQLGFFTYGEFDHLVSSNKRVGHHCGYANCPWHHRAVPFDGMTIKQCEAKYGPSKARGSKPFHQRFGSTEQLLQQQERVLASMPKGRISDLF